MKTLLNEPRIPSLFRIFLENDPAHYARGDDLFQSEVFSSPFILAGNAFCQRIISRLSTILFLKNTSVAASWIKSEPYLLATFFGRN